MTILTKKFWSFAGERAIKTFAQAAVAVLGTGSIGLLTIDYVTLVSISGGAALLSVLTSIISVTSSKED
jgi:threonine dehydrogenase-like Zn-dependent dehydrogenase